MLIVDYSALLENKVVKLLRCDVTLIVRLVKIHTYYMANLDLQISWEIAISLVPLLLRTAGFHNCDN